MARGLAKSVLLQQEKPGVLQQGLSYSPNTLRLCTSQMLFWKLLQPLKAKDIVKALLFSVSHDEMLPVAAGIPKIQP